MATEKNKNGLFQMEKYSRFSSDLLPVIQNLVSLGISESDIGIILGHQGKSAKKYIKDLKARNEDVRLACETGRKIADIQLVTKAWQAAMGGEYEEVEKIYEPVADLMGNSEPKQMLVKTKVTTKLIKPDKTVLIKLLESRLPDQFAEIKRSERQTMNVDIEGQVKDFFGDLSKRRKRVESKDITKEIENEDIGENN